MRPWAWTFLSGYFDSLLSVLGFELRRVEIGQGGLWSLVL